MRRSTRVLEGGRILGLALAAGLLWLPTAAWAQFHGANIGKACTLLCPGHDAQCEIQVQNIDDFNDTIRIDSLCDTVDFPPSGPAGDVTTCAPGAPFLLGSLATKTLTHNFSVPSNLSSVTDQARAQGFDLEDGATGIPNPTPTLVVDLSFQNVTQRVECCADQDCDDHNPCTADSCNLQTHMCAHTPAAQGTPCDVDGSLCTLDQCDGAGTCAPTSSPCVVTVSSPAKTYNSLQKAINGAANGATINVSGLCNESVTISKRKNLTVQGVPPTAGCPADPQPGVLTSTVKGSGPRHVIKVVSSPGTVVRYLNIIDANIFDGLEMKTTSTTTAHCNCIAFNINGIEVDAGKSNQITRNLVEHNTEMGIEVQHGSTGTTVSDNVSRFNGLDGIAVTDSKTNTLTRNSVLNNMQDGIDLTNGDMNQVTMNVVTGNGTNAGTDSGIKVENGSDKNFIDLNTINTNIDNPVPTPNDRIRCILGTMNTGSNVSGTGCL